MQQTNMKPFCHKACKGLFHADNFALSVAFLDPAASWLDDISNSQSDCLLHSIELALVRDK